MTDALDRGPHVLAGYALVQVACLAFSYLAVTGLGFGRRGFMHVELPVGLVVPGVWLLVLAFAVAALAGRVSNR